MQHLNLYSQLDKQVEPLLSARQQAHYLGMVAVLMVVICVLLWFSGSRLDNQLQSVSAEQTAISEQLAAAKAKKARLENNPQLDQSIASLEREVNFRRRLLDTIAPQGASPGKGFAEHLSGLARQHIDGLWFTEIQLQDGGHQMALLGQTRQPEYVPQYLQKLADEEVFAGHRFRVLRMHVPDERRDLHNFELRAKEVGLP